MAQGPEPLRLPAMRRGLPALGGPVPQLRRLEQPRRDARPRTARSPARRPARPGGSPAGSSRLEPLARVSDAEQPRLSVGLPELDRVLGGGLVPGSVVLLGGEPGHRQVDPAPPGGRRRSPAAGGVLYASGEESAAQVRLRATRLGLRRRAGRRAVRVVAEIVDRPDRRPGPGRAAGPPRSSTRSRRPRSTTSTARPAASARSARRRCA